MGYKEDNKFKVPDGRKVHCKDINDNAVIDVGNNVDNILIFADNSVKGLSLSDKRLLVEGYSSEVDAVQRSEHAFNLNLYRVWKINKNLYFVQEVQNNLLVITKDHKALAKDIEQKLEGNRVKDTEKRLKALEDPYESAK